MISKNIHIFLADHDKADCLLFKYGLAESLLSAILTIVQNGEQLMEVNKKESKFPDVLLLNLNQLYKNGIKSLGEIKRNNDLQNLPDIIFPNASDIEKAKNVLRNILQYYICKLPDFSHLKKVIFDVFTLIMQKKNTIIPRQIYNIRRFYNYPLLRNETSICHQIISKSNVSSI